MDKRSDKIVEVRPSVWRDVKSFLWFFIYLVFCRLGAVKLLLAIVNLIGKIRRALSNLVHRM